MLAVSPSWLSVAYVMVAQALSGIAKDLTKMSAKSSVKAGRGRARGGAFQMGRNLHRLEERAKGVGFFLGAALL